MPRSVLFGRLGRARLRLFSGLNRRLLARVYIFSDLVAYDLCQWYTRSGIAPALCSLRVAAAEIGGWPKTILCLESLQATGQQLALPCDPLQELRPCGLMDKALASGAKDCGFESHQGRLILRARNA